MEGGARERKNFTRLLESEGMSFRTINVTFQELIKPLSWSPTLDNRTNFYPSLQTPETLTSNPFELIPIAWIGIILN